MRRLTLALDRKAFAKTYAKSRNPVPVGHKCKRGRRIITALMCGRITDPLGRACGFFVVRTLEPVRQRQAVDEDLLVFKSFSRGQLVKISLFPAGSFNLSRSERVWPINGCYIFVQAALPWNLVRRKRIIPPLLTRLHFAGSESARRCPGSYQLFISLRSMNTNPSEEMLRRSGLLQSCGQAAMGGLWRKTYIFAMLIQWHCCNAFERHNEWERESKGSFSVVKSRHNTYRMWHTRLCCANNTGCACFLVDKRACRKEGGGGRWHWAEARVSAH